jgi:hypothetical protein
MPVAKKKAAKKVLKTDLPQVKFNNASKTIEECCGVSTDQLVEIISDARKKSDNHMSLVEKIWNNDSLTLEARLLTIYSAGRWIEKETNPLMKLAKALSL